MLSMFFLSRLKIVKPRKFWLHKKFTSESFKWSFKEVEWRGGVDNPSIEGGGVLGVEENRDGLGADDLSLAEVFFGKGSVAFGIVELVVLGRLVKDAKDFSVWADSVSDSSSDSSGTGEKHTSILRSWRGFWNEYTNK